MSHGTFIWYELITTDPAAAAAFYAPLLGWHVQDHGSKDAHGGSYQFLMAGDHGIGGLMAQPEPMRKMNLPPIWQAYLQVEDFDAALTGLIADGCQKYMERDEDRVGRFAQLSDPQGAPFYIMQPARPGEGSSAFAPGKPGHVGWNEYHGTDGAAALAFYTKHFGWAHDSDLDMGPMGTYHIFASDGQQAGGIMTDTALPRPAWLFYINVADINAAKAQIEATGGSVVMGRQEVPSGQQVLVVKDPQGGHFALVTAAPVA